MNIDSSIVTSFAPTGKLRASINLGNPILANKDPISSEPFGVSVDLARELAKRLGVEIELVVFDAAGNLLRRSATSARTLASLQSTRSARRALRSPRRMS